MTVVAQCITASKLVFPGAANHEKGVAKELKNGNFQNPCRQPF